MEKIATLARPFSWPKFEKHASMKLDKVIVKGVFFAVLSIALAVFEALTQAAPRYGIIFGYLLVFSYGILVILTRKKRLDCRESGVSGRD